MDGIRVFNGPGLRARGGPREQGGLRRRGGPRARGGQSRAGGQAGANVVELPPVESFLLGNTEGEQSSSLSRCCPFETPLHPKRLRVIKDHEPSNAPQESSQPSTSAEQPSTSATALPLPPQCEVLPPSPASSVICGGSGSSTPAARRRRLNSEELEYVDNYGSDDDSAEESDGDEDALIPTFVPRTSRLFLDLDDDDDDEYDDLSHAQMSGSAPASAGAAPASAGAAPASAGAAPASAGAAPASAASSSVETMPDQTLYPRALFDWTDFPVPSPRRRETFRGVEVGPTAVFRSPYEAFVAIWTPEFMQKIVEETNRYAQQMADRMFDENRLEPNSRITRWCETDVDELYVFFALLLATGLCPKSDIKEYWAKDVITIYPMFGNYMSYNRFLILSSCLHFVDNSIDIRTLTRPQARAAKIQPIIEHLNSRFQALYNLNQNIAIDESLTQWMGWLNFRQLIRTKAAKVGLKTYELCESQTGYLWRFKLYTGREEETRGEAMPGLGYIGTLVLDLLQGLENKGHTVWMDNFYNSPALARVMKSLGFDCAGTLRTNRQNVPPQFKNLKIKDMTRGQVYGCTSGDVDILVWRDTKRVGLISTYHGAGFHTVRGKTKPTVVCDYNICMGGVDKKDQMLSAYPIERKRTRVWYKKLFRRLLNASVLNAFILHRGSAVPNSQPHISNHRVFRKTLVSQLLNNHLKRRILSVKTSTTSKRGPSAPILSQEVLQHFSQQYGFEPGKKGRRRHRCVVCHKQQYTYCPACNVALCMDECTKKYHSS